MELRYRVHVDSIGCMLHADKLDDAKRCFDWYKEQSHQGRGRAAGSRVFIFDVENDEVVNEYEGADGE